MRSSGKFEPRLVTLGLSSNGKVTVLKGIKAGEEIVTSAQFLIDSESKLREATAKMLNGIDDNLVPINSSAINYGDMKADKASSHVNMSSMNHKEMNHD